MTRLSVCSLRVSCNEMIDTPMLLVVISTVLMRFFGYPYNDLVICKDSPDYLRILQILKLKFSNW